ncbi:MAG: hypothetical protein FWE05_02095 [Defluviitaleaceae bacterium]|nr:hypothetical protein [Defluviitaleaceae bacterium]
MDFGLPAVATTMANMETAQTMSIGSVRRGLDQIEQVGAALMDMMQNMQVPLMPAGSESGSRVNMLV